MFSPRTSRPSLAARRFCESAGEKHGRKTKDAAFSYPRLDSALQALGCGSAGGVSSGWISLDTGSSLPRRPPVGMLGVSGRDPSERISLDTGGSRASGPGSLHLECGGHFQVPLIEDPSPHWQSMSECANEDAFGGAGTSYCPSAPKNSAATKSRKGDREQWW